MREGDKSASHRVLSRHVERLGAEIDNLRELDQRYFWVRLAALIAGAVGLFLAYQSRQSSVFLIAILVFLGIFSIVVYLNRRVRRRDVAIFLAVASAFCRRKVANCILGIAITLSTPRMRTMRISSARLNAFLFLTIVRNSRKNNKDGHTAR